MTPRTFVVLLPFVSLTDFLFVCVLLRVPALGGVFDDFVLAWETGFGQHGVNFALNTGGRKGRILYINAGKVNRLWPRAVRYKIVSSNREERGVDCSCQLERRECVVNPEFTARCVWGVFLL